MAAPTDPMLQAIAKFIAANRRAPTPDEIYALADFRRPGGIGRLCAALAAVGSGAVEDSARRREGLSR